MNDIIARGISTIDTEARTEVYREFQQLAQEELPILFLTHFTFITVARDEVQNVANNPRWATSGWADTWIDADQ
jgi:peptide/nickel transport system substrate-binding protein